MGKNTLVHRRRLGDAVAQLTDLQALASFDRIVVEVSDGNRHWRFLCDGRYLLSYWPCVCKAQVTGQDRTVPCSSPSMALKLAKEVLKAQRRPAKPRPQTKNPSAAEDRPPVRVSPLAGVLRGLRGDP